MSSQLDGISLLKVTRRSNSQRPLYESVEVSLQLSTGNRNLFAGCTALRETNRALIRSRELGPDELS
jgi:hypothetical protein